MLRKPHSITTQASSLRNCVLVCCVGLLAAIWSVSHASAASVWDGQSATGWWYDPVNWNLDYNGDTTGNDNNALPYTGAQGPPPGAGTNPGSLTAATEIDNGYGVNQTTGIGDGVVFDPANDPNVALDITNNIPPAPSVGTSYPFQLGRFYLGNGAVANYPTTTNVYNTFTLKSGELDIASQVRVSRVDYSAAPISQTAISKIVQTGGTWNQTDTTNDAYMTLGDVPHTVGIYDYSGGNMFFSTPAGSTSTAPGIRMGISATDVGKFIVRNTGPVGAIQVANFLSGYAGGIGINEFHYGVNPNNVGGVRPIQITGISTANGGPAVASNGQLALRNGVSDGVTPLTQAAELSLVLDSAPHVNGSAVPDNLGLFSFVTGATGINTSTGNPKIFYGLDGITPYNEGSTVSAVFGGNTYNWTISYLGKITYNNAATSDIQSITNTGGTDIVLMGLSSTVASLLKGDLNFDGHVNAADIRAMELALSNESGYLSTDFGNGTPTSHGVTTANIGQYSDVSGGNAYNNGNLQALLTLLKTGGGSATSVPEPSSFVLAGLGLAAIGLLQRRRRLAA